jgi:hypothetical protein
VSTALTALVQRLEETYDEPPTTGEDLLHFGTADQVISMLRRGGGLLAARYGFFPRNRRKTKLFLGVGSRERRYWMENDKPTKQRRCGIATEPGGMTRK